MPRLNRLNHSLLRSVSRAALGAEAPAEDENDTAEGEDEDTPPAGRRGRKSKKAGKGKSRRSEEQDEDTAEDADEPDGDEAEGEDDDPDAEDDLDPDAEDDDESAEGEDDEGAEGDDEDDTAEGEDEDPDAEDDEEAPPAGRRGRKSRKSKASAKGGRTVNSGERARIAAITRSKLAAGREDLADFLAFDTGLSSRTCLAILKHSPKARTATTLRSRMASVENPKIKQGTGKATDDEQVVVAAAAKTLKGFGF